MVDSRDSVRTKLLGVYTHSGRPMATIYLPSPSAVEDAAKRHDIEVGNVFKELAELGVSDQFEEVVAEALAEHQHRDDAALALVATPCEILLAHHLQRPISRAVVAVGRTPRLLPLLQATQCDIDHLAVLLDRTGADVWHRDGVGDPIDTMVVSGQEHHVHRGHPGGWSQRRFQQIAENAWERNAKQVVDAVVSAAPDAEVVVAAGDVRAVGFFTEHLPERLRPPITVDGSRSAEHGAFLDNVDVAIRSLAAEVLVAELKAAREALATGRGATGDEVLDLLVQGRIDRLYVANDTFASNRPTAPMALPAAPSTASDPATTTTPVTDGAVALAAVTGAGVVVVPATGVAGIDGPIAGVLRG